MTRIKVVVTRTKVVAHLFGQLTSGMVGVPVSFVFDSSWNDLEKTAVFKTGDQIRDQLSITDKTTVPWEVLTAHGKSLYVGVYGISKDGSVVVPTVWAEVGKIQAGADPSGDPGADPTLPPWEQISRDLEAVLDELHAYAQALAGGGAE